MQLPRLAGRKVIAIYRIPGPLLRAPSPAAFAAFATIFTTVTATATAAPPPPWTGRAPHTTHPPSAAARSPATVQQALAAAPPGSRAVSQPVEEAPQRHCGNVHEGDHVDVHFEEGKKAVQRERGAS